MRRLKEHTYKGHEIVPCGCGDREERWFVQAYHSPTGIAWAEELCKHAWTLADAKDWIDDLVAHEEV